MVNAKSRKYLLLQNEISVLQDSQNRNGRMVKQIPQKVLGKRRLDTT